MAIEVSIKTVVSPFPEQVVEAIALLVERGARVTMPVTDGLPYMMLEPLEDLLAHRGVRVVLHATRCIRSLVNEARLKHGMPPHPYCQNLVYFEPETEPR